MFLARGGGDEVPWRWGLKQSGPRPAWVGQRSLLLAVGLVSRFFKSLVPESGGGAGDVSLLLPGITGHEILLIIFDQYHGMVHACVDTPLLPLWRCHPCWVAITAQNNCKPRRCIYRKNKRDALQRTISQFPIYPGLAHV